METGIRSIERPTTTSRAGTDLVALWATLAGAACLVVAIFMPYVSPPGEFSRVVDNQLVQQGGWVFAVLGLAAVVLLVAIDRLDLARRWHAGLVAVGALSCALAVVRLVDTEGRTLGSATPTDGLSLSDALEVMSTEVVASPGVGVYAALVGGVLVIAGGLLSITRRA